MSAMKLPESQALLIGGGVVLLIAAAWTISKLSNLDAGDTARKVAEGAVDVVAGTALGVVSGVNDALGIPTTSDVVDWANGDSNPVKPVGVWLSGVWFDLMNP